MVSSVQPQSGVGLAGLQGSLNNPGAQRAEREDNARRGQDSVSIRPEASLAQVRDGLAGAQGSLDLALAAGREASNILAQLRDLARSAQAGPDEARAAADQSFQALLQRYGQVIDAAIKGGADLLAGKSLTVTLDPDAPPVEIAGYDLRLKDEPGGEDVLRLSLSSNLSDPGAALSAARDADASLGRLDAVLSRLSSAAQRLSAHERFLGALDGAAANADLDAEGARLTALQLRQTLTGAGAIANAAPQSLLALFRE